MSLRRINYYDSVPIVIDNGTSMTRAGFAGEEIPRTIFPSIIGRPKYKLVMMGVPAVDHHVGMEAQARRGLFHMKYPIERGIITNWDDMEKIWDYIFVNKLNVMPDEHSVMLTDAPHNPSSQKEKMVQYMFEVFNAQGVYVALPAVLSLYSVGRLTGIVHDSGQGLSQTVPIYDGYSMPSALERMDFAGADVTEYLTKILTERGYNLSTRGKLEIAKDIKEQLGFVSLDYEKGIATSAATGITEASYELPDGQVIILGNERFRAPEILFRPRMRGTGEEDGVHSIIHRCVENCDLDLRSNLLTNIVLSGGNTMFEGFVERLEIDLLALLPARTRIRIIAPADRTMSTWIGGSILASLKCFPEMCLSKHEYFEIGPSAIHRKF